MTEIARLDRHDWMACHMCESVDLLWNWLARDSGLITFSLASAVRTSNELAAANITNNDLADSAILVFFNTIYLESNNLL